MSTTWFGPIRIDGLPLAALGFVDGAIDALAYVEETQDAPPADPARMPDDPQEEIYHAPN